MAFQTSYAGSIPVARSTSDQPVCTVIVIFDDRLWHHMGREWPSGAQVGRVVMLVSMPSVVSSAAEPRPGMKRLGNAPVEGHLRTPMRLLVAVVCRVLVPVCWHRSARTAWRRCASGVA
jgi:hypothetical protein